MTEVIIVVAFLAFIGFREWMTNARFRDLELKLMARDPQEYARYKTVENPPKERRVEKDDEDLVDPFEVDAGDALKGLLNKE